MKDDNSSIIAGDKAAQVEPVAEGSARAVDPGAAVVADPQNDVKTKHLEPDEEMSLVALAEAEPTTMAQEPQQVDKPTVKPEKDKEAATDPPKATRTVKIKELKKLKTPSIQRAAKPVKAKNSSNSLTTLIVNIVAALLVFGGGSFALYTWYQNPQKVVADALIYMLKDKTVNTSGIIKLDSSSADTTMVLRGQVGQGAIHQQVTATIFASGDQATDLPGERRIEGDVLYDGDGKALYLRANDLAGGQWIDVPANKIDEVVNLGGSSCIATAIGKVVRAESALNEVVDIYRAHQFIIVRDELGTVGDSVGYLIGLDAARARSFGDAIVDSALGRGLQKCGLPAKDVFGSVNGATGGFNLELWVDKWSHIPTRFVLKAEIGDDAVDIEIKTEFDTGENIQLPSDARSFDEFRGDIESLFLTTALSAKNS